MNALRTIVSGILFVSSIASAETILSRNIIMCDVVNGFQRYCKLPERLELIPRQNIESEFYVSYKMTCDRRYSGPQASKIQLQLDTGAPFTLNFHDVQNQVLVGTGQGPLSLVDSFPKELANRSFLDCQLSFTEIRAIPSSRVRSVWQTELNGLEALLSSKLALITSLEQVTLIMPAYKFFKNLSESLDADMKQSEEVLELSRELSSCKQGDDCDILFRLSSDTSLSLTLEERLLIMQLRSLLSELPAREGPVTLMDRLSAGSIATLSKLGEDAAFYEEAEETIKIARLEIETIRNRMSTLEAQLAGGSTP